MSGTPITIGKLSETTGVKITTIRYYETTGLLPDPPRSTGNRRTYGPEHVKCLIFIKCCRGIGLSFDAIKDLLTLEMDPAQSCAAADRIAKTHLVEIDRKIEELTNLKARFSAVVAQCEGTRVETCSILKALHDCPDHGNDR